MTTHHCTDRCSHRATADSLTALGFAVRKHEMSMGTLIVLREGASFENARHAACEAGVLRTCTRTERNS